MKTSFRCLLTLGALATSLAAGDLTITYQASTKVMGKTMSGTQTHYYSPLFHKTTDPSTQQDSLVDFQKGVIYTIKHKDKKIESMTFDDLAAMAQPIGQKLDAMPAFVKGMMGGSDAEAKVEPTGASTVAGRACKNYRVTIGKMVYETSQDPTLMPPVPVASYRRFMQVRGNMVPGPMGASYKKLYTEMSKLQGMSIKNRMTGIMGMDSTQEATAVSTSPIPAATFVLPQGYKTEDAGKKLRQQMQAE